jgi:ketosteroid isomerase-like protein
MFMSQRLPVRPNLDQLKRHAKTVLRIARIDRRDWQLADAQRAIALGFGFRNWADLKRRVLALPQSAATNTPNAMQNSSRGPTRILDQQFAGVWVSDDRRRTLLAIEVTDGAIVLTQIATGEDGRPVANALVLKDDGRDHPLPHGDDFTVRACWRDSRSLQTIVRRGDAMVAEGVYTLAPDGQTLTTQAGTQRHRFKRLIAIAAAIATVAATGCAARADAHRRAIEALNQHDIKAALASDVDAVITQWSDDFVQIPPAGPAIRGRAANVAVAEQARQQLQVFEPVAYTVDFAEITISGEYAFGWGTYRNSQTEDGWR